MAVISCPTCSKKYLKLEDPEGVAQVYRCVCETQFNDQGEVLAQPVVPAPEPQEPEITPAMLEALNNQVPQDLAKINLEREIHDDFGQPSPEARHNSLQHKPVAELRKIVRQEFDAGKLKIQHPKPGTWIASASKKQCLNLLETGEYKPGQHEPAEPDEVAENKPKPKPQEDTSMPAVIDPQNLSPEDLKALEALKQLMGNKPAPLNEDRVREIAREEDEKFGEAFREHIEHSIKDALAQVQGGGKPETVVIRENHPEPVNVGRQHKYFLILLAMLSARTPDGGHVPVWIPGPAGSFKTHATHQAAIALGLQYRSLSLGPQTTKTDLVGYMGPNGYVPTGLYETYKDGGVFNFDEIDATNPGVLTMVNALLSNSGYDFPCGRVERHKDFIPVACANTLGTGAGRVYVGRMQQDGATRDRWAFLPWDYDEELEQEIAGDDAVFNAVIAIRRAVEKLGLREIVSPRATFSAVSLKRAGIALKTCIELAVYNKMEDDAVKRIKASLK
jgi:cobaltochelatase CobS